MKQLQNNAIVLDIHHLCIVSLVGCNKKQKEKWIACMKGHFTF